MGEPTKSSFKVNDESLPEGHWQGKYEDFKKLGDGLDIDTFSKSADPYAKAQGLLMATYEELSTQAYSLADLWQGKASVEFQKNLKALYESACALADATGQVNVAIGYHASDLQTLKENVDKMKPDTSESAGDWFFGDSWDPLGISHRTTDAEQHQNQANQKVQDWVNKDLTHNTTSYTYTELPKSVHLTIPNPTPGAYDPNKTKPGGPDGPGGLPTGGGGGGGMPNMTPTTPHTTPPTPHLTPTSYHPNTDLTNLPSHHTPATPPGSDLSGLDTHMPGGPGGGPNLSQGLGGPGGGGGPGLGGLDPHGGGLGGPGGGLGGPGMSGLGARGAGANGAGLGGAAAEEAAAQRAAMGGRGGMNGGMPMGMGAGAGGGQEQERERTTWLTEDEDVWGGDGDVAPPVIG